MITRVVTFPSRPPLDPLLNLLAPGTLMIYQHPQFDKEVAKKAFFADSIELRWNSTGTAMLLLVNQDVDAQNYYGKRALYFMNLESRFDCRVTDDFVHDVQWNPNGNEFAVIYGNMPFTKVSFYDLKCSKRADLGGNEARNKLLFDPYGQMLCVGGFGSLNGDMDFWDLSKENLVKVGSANAFSSSFHQWCPNSYHFLACVVSPRMKMDNGIKIFNYHGEKVYEEAVEELYQVEWCPEPKGTYPKRDISPPRATKTTAAAQPAKYRHPHFTECSTVVGGVESTPVRYSPSGLPMRQLVGGTPVASKGKKKKKKPQKPAQDQQPQQQQQQQPQQKQKQQQPQQQQQQQPQQQQQQQPQQQQQQQPQQKQKQQQPQQESRQDFEKRKKQIEVKLQQIEVLKHKRSTGQPLDLNQINKIDSEDTLREELANLLRGR
eukprot:TRINITY_DN6491_c0_g1_i2.p1 TRINITY_DN6491_c0_g1~~TRINITY_DN6491_c0_g1_i2.p1  ORF type:complete len:433 (+),score=145.64 TRINITY_DN6491_c0_g1_i2:761-2059(+)